MAGTADPIGAAGGDLSGTYPNPTVARLQGRSVASDAPADGQVLKWSAANNRWEPAIDLRDAFWQASRTSIFYTAGNVGIGTSSPLYQLHVDTRDGDRAIAGIHTEPALLSYGVYGESRSRAGWGVFGLASATSGYTYGVRGESQSTSGTGVFGLARATSGTTYGVLGNSDSPSGYGVYFVNRLAGTGTKSFQMDHPLRPETHYLNHFCAEGPEPYNIYRGTATLDARGEAWIQLPDYYEAINRDPTYHLTPIGASMPNLYVAVEIQGNRFKIAGGVPGKKVSWEVKVVRNDLWVQRYGYQAEPEKPEEHQGKYLYPELYGQPKERGVHYHPEREQPAAPEKPR